ncbi:MAG: hypothetical protein WCF48_05290 [Terriglobales bacterium]
MSSLFPSVGIGRMWKLKLLTLSIVQPMSDKADIQPGMLRIVETGELRKEAKVVLILIDQPRNRVVGIDYHYFLPFQMRVRQPEQLETLKMSCGNVAWTDVVLTLTTEKFTDNPNYGLKIKDIHLLTPEERQHLAGIMAIVNQSKARND